MFFFFEQAPHLSIRIDNSEPVSAQDFAGLLQALADDYRTISEGRTLIVGRIEEGSIITVLQDAAAWAAPHLKDAAAIAAAANSLKGLYISISGLIVKVQRRERTRTRQAGIKSVQKIVAIGVAARANVDVTFKTRDGDELKATVTFDQAKQIAENIEPGSRRSKSLNDPAEVDMPLDDVLDAKLGQLLFDQNPEDIDEARKRIAELVQSLHRFGLLEAIVPLAETLNRKGRQDLAMLLTKEANRLRRDRG